MTTARQPEVKAAQAQHSPLRDLLRTSRTLTDTESALLAHAQRLVDALNDIVHGSDPKPRAREALAEWSKSR